MKKILYYIAAAVLAAVLTIIPLCGGSYTDSDDGLLGAEALSSAESTVAELCEKTDGEIYDYILGKLNDAPRSSSVSVEITESVFHFDAADSLRYFGSSALFAPREIKNILVTVKTSAAADNDVILIAAHFDRAAGSVGAYDSALNIAVMLENFKRIAYGTQELRSSNTVAFLFTSGYHEGDLGLRKFLDLKSNIVNSQDNYAGYARERAVLNNLRLVVNLENFGADGALMLFDTSAADYNLVRLYIEGGGSAARAGSAVKEIYRSAFGGGSSELFKATGAQLLSFAAFGDAHIVNTNLDRYHENFNRDLLMAAGENLAAVLNTFGTISLDAAVTLGNTPNAIYFDFLGLTVNMSFLGAFIILALTLLCLAAALVLNYRRGRYNYYKILLASSINLLIIVAAFLETAIFKLLLGIFGGTLGAVLASPFYSSTLILAGFVLFGLASMTAWRFAYEKFLKNKFKNPDLIPTDMDFSVSAAFIFILASLVFTVFLPSASYLFSFIALVCAAGLLVKNLVNKDAFTKLNLDILGVILSIPLYISFARGLNLISGASALTEAIPLFGILFMFVLSAAGKLGAEAAAAPKATEAKEAELQSAECGTAPARKSFRLTSLAAACTAAIVGFAFILGGGLSVNTEFGMRFYKEHLNAFDTQAYKNAVNYVYEENISRGANYDDAEAVYSSSRYEIAGSNIYKQLKKYTDIFSRPWGGVSYAAAPNLAPAKKPSFAIIEPLVMVPAEAEDTELDGDELFIYRIEIQAAEDGNPSELVVPSMGGELSVIVVIVSNELVVQFDAPFNKDTVLYLGKSCVVDLYYSSPVTVTLSYREVYLNAGAGYAAVMPELRPLNSIDGLRFNILYKCKINLAPRYHEEVPSSGA